MKKIQGSAPAIQVIGTGEAFSPDLGNTSYLFRGKGFPTILFDCGYQIPQRLWKWDLHGEIDVICITHIHADHAFGIVPLICRYWEEKRKKPLRIISGRGTEKHFRKLIDMGYPGIAAKLLFELSFVEISAQKEIDFKCLSIRAARSHHSVQNHTYRVDFPGGKYRSLAVSGDGQITEQTCALVGDVDLLLQEMFSLNKDIPSHTDLQSFEKWAAKTSIGKIGLAHNARTEIKAVRRRVQALNRKDPRWVILEPEMVIPLIR